MGEERGVYFEEHNITKKHIVGCTPVALNLNWINYPANSFCCERNEVWNYLRY